MAIAKSLWDNVMLKMNIRHPRPMPDNQYLTEQLP